MPHSKTGRKKSPKRILALPDLEHAKTAVLNSLTSASGQRAYVHAIREFVAWYCSEPRLAFNRTVVLRYRIHLEQCGYAPATINLGRWEFAAAASGGRAARATNEVYHRCQLTPQRLDGRQGKRRNFRRHQAPSLQRQSPAATARCVRNRVPPPTIRSQLLFVPGRAAASHRG